MIRKQIVHGLGVMRGKLYYSLYCGPKGVTAPMQEMKYRVLLNFSTAYASKSSKGGAASAGDHICLVRDRHAMLSTNEPSTEEAKYI